MSRLQLERVFTIDRKIRDSEFPNADSLSAEFEVSRRVIFHDRKFLLERLGAPLQFNRARGGWYYSEPTWVLPTAMVTQGELLAFFLSVEVARRNMGGALEATLVSAVQKIAHTLPLSVEVELESLRAHYSFAAPSSASADESTLMALHDAIHRQREVEIFYYAPSTGQRSTRIVQPYDLYNSRGDWYLITFDLLRQAWRFFHVGRIARYRVLDKGFVRDPAFDIKQYLRQAFVTEMSATTEEIVIRFDEYQARYIRERRFHETQTLEELPDGGAILRFQSGGLGEIKRWVLQYGAHAEVLAPPQLRTEVQSEIEALQKVYGRERSE